MNLNKENTDTSETSAEKKEWKKPQMREFIIGQVTSFGSHCGGNDCTFSS